MLRPRVIPCLLMKNKGLVKGVNFRNHTYVGDPINAVNIFNMKEVDELVLLDINATHENRLIDPDYVKIISNECFMPLCVGGGITSVDDAAKLFSAGAEKVSINSAAMANPGLITDIASHFGSQSVVVSLDIKKKRFGNNYLCYSHCGKKKHKLSPVEMAKIFEDSGAGELLINSIDRDGTMSGYELDVISEIAANLSIPTMACGGAGSLNDISSVLKQAHVSAAVVGSKFVFHGSRRAVLISYPSSQELHASVY